MVKQDALEEVAKQTQDHASEDAHHPADNEEPVNPDPFHSVPTTECQETKLHLSTLLITPQPTEPLESPRREYLPPESVDSITATPSYKLPRREPRPTALEGTTATTADPLTVLFLQVRFELTFFALNPELNVVAPWREWDITGREDAIEYDKKHNVPVPVTKKSMYSRDRNLWHLSHEGDILEDPANEPKKDMYMMSVDPEDAPDEPQYVEIGIDSGIPVSLNGRTLSPASLLAELNEIGGRHEICRFDMVENRLVGMKSRGVYETPGGTILFNAVGELESLTLDRETIQVKDSLALKYAELVYAGRWFDLLVMLNL
ncbi:LOW QUALITY PROTEIN: argininosuccinate synthase, chloroplastic-like [Hibiscus syriacus]|uniref:LOW QUALITY PROTEIN: argininosuccinate synthase, chloroplastic-like n=1 Tax=Hibiscus syriacus TaxID=106335 RepID=UPI001921ACFA|nr:LOW QUALITY PROTEIN: argininosuccinate synthase, chloroplastic-like [Hibiscus syriacus]